MKFKQALKTVNIPREPIQYAIINQQEQNAIMEIYQSIKKVENLIIENNANSSLNKLENELNSRKGEICSVFDTIHQIINEKKENILDSLEQNFENKKLYNQKLAEYLDEARNIKSKCQQLILNKNHLSRNHLITDLKQQCISKLNELLKLNKKYNIKINDTQKIKQSIQDLVVIAEEQRENAKSDRFSDSNKENHNTTNKWNLNTSMVAFSDIKPVDGFRNTQWGFDQDQKKDFGSFEAQPAFDMNNLTQRKKKNESKTSNVTNKNDDNNDENCKEITFKPVIKLEEQSVDTGHENEELLKSFMIKSLYHWGKDATGQSTWKSRAASTKLSFYVNTSKTKARLVCREYKTNKLRLNHNIPAQQHANLDKKSDKLIIWTAFDTTIEENYEKGCPTTFCAKFNDATS